MFDSIYEVRVYDVSAGVTYYVIVKAKNESRAISKVVSKYRIESRNFRIVTKKIDLSEPYFVTEA